MHGQHAAFNWVSVIPGLQHAPNHVVMAYFVAILLVILGGLASIKLKAAKDPVVPEATLTYRNFFDLIAEKLYGLCEATLGAHAAEQFFPLIGTLFLFIFTSNLLGLIPGLLPPTDNINVTLGCGVFVFLFYNFQGIKANGIGYLKHFMGPIWAIAPLMFAIEVVSHLVRPLSLGLRLRGNIMGDHLVVTVFQGIFPYLLPVPFMLLGLLVALIQAYVFCLLTMVYISLSIAHDH
jgi:F-type H+-transporting ATPase subunit a